MKIKLFSLTIATVCSLPLAGFAQGTYLSAPDGNPTNALIVAPGGNIGIGTGPGVRLDVSGPPLVNGDARHLLYLTDNTAFGPGVGAGVSFLGNYNRSETRANFAGIKGIKENATDGDYSGALVFTTTPNNGSPKERIRITSDGNFGIGTTSPTAKLEIRSAGSEANLHINADSASGLPVLRLERQGICKWGWLGEYPSPGKCTFFSYEGSGGTVLTLEDNGNVGIGTTTPQAKLDVAGKVNCTVLELTSDRAQKSGFAPLDCGAILSQVASLPLSTWHYTNETSVTHIGPMAQDFQAAFRVGSDDKHIATVDADGVLFAAVQALNQKLEAELESKAARIASLEKEVASLRTDFASRLGQLEKRFAHSSPAPAETSPSLPTVASAAER